MGTGAAMGTAPRRGFDGRVGARMRTVVPLLGRVALAAHAGAERLVVARLAFPILARAAVGRAADAACRRADGRARARVATGRADRRTESRAAQRPDGQSDARALGGVRARAVTRLLLGPGLAGARVLRLLLRCLALRRVGVDAGRGLRR